MSGRYLLLADIDLGSESADALQIRVVLPTAVVGVPYVGALIASGGTEPYTYDDSPPGTVPPGLTIDPSTGDVDGTPNAVGYYEFTASVTDSALSPATASIVVSIRVVSGIAFSGAFAPGEVGIAYSSGLSAAGGTPPYTWSVPSGTEPTGLAINATTGLEEGTPSVAGTFNLTVRATDSLGNPQDFPTSITIAAALDITTTSFPDGFVGVYYNAGPTVIGGVSPISYAITSGSNPPIPGTSFQPATGFVTGTPTTPGTYAFDITGTDALGGVSTVSLSVDITTGGGGAGVTSINGATGIVTETSLDGSIGIANTPGANGTIDLTSRLIARLATVAALPANNYANGSSGVGATLTGTATGVLTVDGSAVALNDFVLVLNEVSQLKNGYYKCTTAGAIGVAYVLTRATRMDTTDEFAGALVEVLSGTVNAGALFLCVTLTPTVGTAAVTFSVPLANSGVTAATYGDASHVSQLIVNAKGLITSAANVLITPSGIGAAAMCQVDVYTSGTPTWNKPANARLVEVIVIGGGGGGGSGGAGGIRSGGASGGGGAGMRATFQPSVLGSTAAVVVATGGNGGTGIANAAGPIGNPGAQGGDSSFNGTIVGFGGGGGGAGANSASTGGGGGGGISRGTTASATSGPGGELGGANGVQGVRATSNANYVGGAAGSGSILTAATAPAGSYAVGGGQSGGGGGGVSTGLANPGGAGAVYGGQSSVAGGAAGVGGSTLSSLSDFLFGAGGGGGGATITNGATAGTGGKGQQGGGSGGGGGACSGTLAVSGTGGAGGDGLVIVITWF